MLVTVIWAPGTIPPVSSLTEPAIVAVVVCATPMRAHPKTTNSMYVNSLYFRRIILFSSSNLLFRSRSVRLSRQKQPTGGLHPPDQTSAAFRVMKLRLHVGVRVVTDVGQ